MKRVKSIELLNLAVHEELSAVHQYMYFHFRCDDLGYELLSRMFKRIAIHEMVHVGQLSERILFLKGDVDLVPSGKVEKLADPENMLEKAYRMEVNSINKYNAWICGCDTELDTASKTLFENLAKEEKVHRDQYGTELDRLKQSGDKYLALQSVERKRLLQDQREVAVCI